MKVFDDDRTNLKEEVRELLEDYTIQEILEYNDITEAEAIYQLWTSGWIDLPETKPITFKSQGGPVRFDEEF